jgi:hypothetical protein
MATASPERPADAKGRGRRREALAVRSRRTFGCASSGDLGFRAMSNEELEAHLAKLAEEIRRLLAAGVTYEEIILQAIGFRGRTT